MPLVHECNQLGCHRICPANHKYCDVHYQRHLNRWRATEDHGEKLKRQRHYNRYDRDPKSNAFYHGKRWTATRDFVKRRDFMTSGVSCRVVNDHDYIIDHIVPRRLCRDPYDVNNLWILSRAEHNKKTNIEENLSDKILKSMTKSDWISRLQR